MQRPLLAENPLVHRVYDSGANFLLVQLLGEDPDAAASSGSKGIAGREPH